MGNPLPSAFCLLPTVFVGVRPRLPTGVGTKKGDSLRVELASDPSCPSQQSFRRSKRCRTPCLDPTSTVTRLTTTT